MTRKTARHLIFLQIQPIYPFNFTERYLLAPTILSCQELTVCHCQAQDIASHARLYAHTAFVQLERKEEKEGGDNSDSFSP